MFKPYRISDHSPTVLKIPLVKSSKPKPFKFANFVTRKNEFIPEVIKAWNSEIDGYSMFRVVKKPKKFKPGVRKLMWKDGNVHTRVKSLRAELDVVQMALDKNP